MLGDGVLFDIVATLGVAVLVGVLFQRLRQSVMLAYLVAGLLVGPSALGVVRDTDAFSAMGEVGVALLLFTIGLELPWARLRRFGVPLIGAGALQVALIVGLATPFLHWHGVSWGASAALAMAISMSSTAVVIRMLADRAETDSVHGLSSLGMLLAQDLLVVLLLLVVPQLGGEGSFAEAAGGLGISLSKLLGLVAAMGLLELVVMRRAFRNAALGSERELLALSSFVVSLGAITACFALDLSPALGGFVAGVIMADAPYADQVRAETAPLRMVLVALFFAWVGMLADLGWIVDHAGQIAGAVVGILIAKFAITYLALRVMRVAGFVAVLTAAALAQMGEFSFAVMATAQQAGIVGEAEFQLFISASVITLLLSPALLGTASQLVHRAISAPLLAVDARGRDHRHGHAIVIGYGPAGREVVRSLLDAGVLVTVIELNPRVQHDVFDGVEVIFGDAAQREILERADVAGARLAVITIPEPSSLRRMVRQIAALAPHVPIVARGRYHIYIEQIGRAGAGHVVDEETVTGRELAQVALSVMNAAHDQP